MGGDGFGCVSGTCLPRRLVWGRCDTRAGARDRHNIVERVDKVKRFVAAIRCCANEGFDAYSPGGGV